MRCIPPRAAFQQATRQSFNNWTVCAKMFVIWQDISTFCGIDWIDSSAFVSCFCHLFPPASSRLSLDLFFFEQYKNNVCLIPPHAKEKINYVDRAIGVEPTLSNVHKNTNEKCQQWNRIWGLTVLFLPLHTHTHTNKRERRITDERKAHLGPIRPTGKSQLSGPACDHRSPKLVSVNQFPLYLAHARSMSVKAPQQPLWPFVWWLIVWLPIHHDDSSGLRLFILSYGALLRGTSPCEPLDCADWPSVLIAI